ncbi:MAG TPA: YezD family protein [Methylophilaceae bacterium]|nr:YezD family protein [Methylophilaceae bacterium]
MSQDSTPEIANEIVQEILHAIREIRFGSIEVTVHEGRVTQIERREKVRFNTEQQRNKPTANAAANT